MTFTEQLCKDIGITLGMPEDKALEFYHHYNRQGWVFGNGQPVKNLKSAMWYWQRKGYEFDSNGRKMKLLPIPSKVCSERGCGLPAVYKDSSGDYDRYKCSEHMPEKVKEKYQ